MADKPDPYTEAEQFAMRTLMDVLNLTPHTDDLCDGTLAEMSGVYATLTEALNALTELRDDLANAMGELMETDLAVIDGVGGFERSRRTSIKWDTVAVRSLMRRHVIGTVADPDTGEVNAHDVEVVDRAFELVSSLYSLSSPKVGGLRALDADPDEYREVTRYGYRVKFIPSKSDKEKF
jgi:hypothetical protein